MEVKLSSLLLICSVLNITKCAENNVCPTLKDYYTVKENPNCWYDIAAEGNITDIIINYGYLVEEHKVVTPDGYILSLVRIPPHHSIDTSVTKSPILLEHGWLYSGASFVGLGKQSLALVLANAGYDVWIGNFRGTEYSEGHVNLTVRDKQYWDYSLDHLALYDIPSQLEYIADVTDQKGNIVYIGYSMGGTTGFMYGSTFPEEAKETIKLFIFLGPGVQFFNTKAIALRAIPIFIDIALGIVFANDLIRIASQAEPMHLLIHIVCLESPLLMKQCMQLMNWLMFGPNTQIKESTIPVFLHQIAAGMSLKVAKQLGDASTRGLRKHDYGKRNMEVYGTAFSPAYNISKIEVPIFIMYSTGDWGVTKEDTYAVFHSLSPKSKIYGIYGIDNLYFNHNDFLYGKNAEALVYDPILELLEKIQ